LDDVTLVYLVQHGEKEPLPGDPGLTRRGQEQARLAGRHQRGYLHPRWGVQISAIFAGTGPSQLQLHQPQRTRADRETRLGTVVVWGGG